MTTENNSYKVNNNKRQVYFNKVKIGTLTEIYGTDFLINYFSGGKLSDTLKKTFEVDEQDILNLFDACNEVLKNSKLAKELLPVDDDNYDEVYFDTVEEVRDRIKYDIMLNLGDNSYIETDFYK